MSEKLKPCPFCGGEAYHTNLMYVQCVDCPAIIDIVSDDAQPTTEKAIAAWNNRKEEGVRVTDLSALFDRKTPFPKITSWDDKGDRDE